MALAKLNIKPLPPSKLAEKFGTEGIKVLFNPNSYSITKQVTWISPNSSNGKKNQTQRKGNAPILTFGGGGSRQLTLELFFDVTEPVEGKKLGDVRLETNKIVALTRIERDLKKPQPPVCEVSWGKGPPPGSDFPFTGVISNLTEKFTLFTSDGVPVRATLTVVFMEFLDPEKDKRQIDPELTTRVIKQGDTLSSIAAEVYHNPNLWRAIAEANQLDDPRQLQVGQRLIVPKLR